jgi:hypothetical protein
VICTSPFTQHNGRGQVGFHHLLARSNSPPCPGLACIQTPGNHALRYPIYRASGLGAQVFEWRGHLIPDKTRHNHRCPHTPSNRHSSTRIYPVTAWHSNSTTRTRIIGMIILTLDKLTRWGRGSPQMIMSTRDPDGKHHGRSPVPGATTPPPQGKEVWGHANLNSVMG